MLGDGARSGESTVTSTWVSVESGECACECECECEGECECECECEFECECVSVIASDDSIYLDIMHSCVVHVFGARECVDVQVASGRGPRVGGVLHDVGDGCSVDAGEG